jgi:hypothetical protein
MSANAPSLDRRGASSVHAVVPAKAAENLPQPDHVVIVALENHSFGQIIDPNQAPFVYDLTVGGALFVNAFRLSSEPTELFCPVQRLDPGRARQ